MCRVALPITTFQLKSALCAAERWPIVHTTLLVGVSSFEFHNYSMECGKSENVQGFFAPVHAGKPSHMSAPVTIQYLKPLLSMTFLSYLSRLLPMSATLSLLLATRTFKGMWWPYMAVWGCICVCSLYEVPGQVTFKRVWPQEDCAVKLQRQILTQGVTAASMFRV